MICLFGYQPYIISLRKGLAEDLPQCPAATQLSSEATAFAAFGAVVDGCVLLAEPLLRSSGDIAFLSLCLSGSDSRDLQPLRHGFFSVPSLRAFWTA